MTQLITTVIVRGEVKRAVSIQLRAAGCHGEERVDEAISHFMQSTQRDCFASLAVANWWSSSTPARVNGSREAGVRERIGYGPCNINRYRKKQIHTLSSPFQGLFFWHNGQIIAI